jgi:hypothetical protein
MKQYDYEGVDKNGRAVRGTTAASSKEEVKAQLKEFGFSDIRVKTKRTQENPIAQPQHVDEAPQVDLVQQLVDGDVKIEDEVDEEDAAQAEWRRLEVISRVRTYRRKENITIFFTLVIVGILATYFIIDKMTEIKAPQPRIITRSGSEMLSFKDVYVDGTNLVFIVYGKDWNGNVRVDFKAWDPFELEVDHGTARLGFIGDHYGGAPEKSGTFNLKKTRYYETIELRVNGDEGR